MIKYYFILFLFCFIACKEKTDEGSVKHIDENTTIEKPVPVVYNIPNPGEIFTGEEIENAMNLAKGSMYVVKNNGSVSSRTRSAFYRVDDPEKGNAAILLQISGNPIADEYPDWDLDFIRNKKMEGEKSLGNPDMVYTYLDFPFGEEGAYNAKQRKYYWRSKDRLIYMLAFNVSKTDEEVHKAAKKLAKIAVEKVN